jgi:hypothetical protein
MNRSISVKAMLSIQMANAMPLFHCHMLVTVRTICIIDK